MSLIHSTVRLFAKRLLVKVLLTLPLVLLTSGVEAEDATTETPALILSDLNGNGVIKIAAFGDSITRGVGDGIEPGVSVESGTLEHPDGPAGYPMRVELWAGINLVNLGKPAEVISEAGLYRFPAAVPATGADYVIISGGTNDILAGISSTDYGRAVQTMINIAKAQNIQPILASNPPETEYKVIYNSLVDAYNGALSTLASVNELTFTDVHHAFTNTCDVNDCYLINLPEGKHPNSAGYDVMAYTIIASLYQIDLFADTGAALLEQVLGLPAGTVTVHPDSAAVSS